MSEQWRLCPSWPDYEVSDLGNVRRVVRVKGAFGPRKPYATKFGYLYLVMRDGHSNLATGVHRLVAEAFIGPSPFEGAQVAHWDGNKANNTPSNLRWTTRAENEGDKVRHGVSNRGERQGRSKLKPEDVLLIRDLLRRGTGQEDIAARFGTARTTISSIAIGKSWRHLHA